MVPFSLQDIATYASFGFTTNPKKHSGLPFRERKDSEYGEVDILVKSGEGNETGYHIENWATYPDGKGGYEDEHYKTYSKPHQTLETFLEAEGFENEEISSMAKGFEMTD